MKKITRIELYLAQRGNCFYCFRPMIYMRGQGVTNYTVDHFLPKCKGNKINNNMVLSCPRCNLKKGHRAPTEAERIRKDILYGKIKERRELLREAEEKDFYRRGLVIND